MDFGKKGISRPRLPPGGRSAGLGTAEAAIRSRGAEGAGPSGGERLTAALPLLTFALTLGLWTIFRLQTRLAFDIGADGAISLDSLVAQGADSFDLAIRQGEVWRLALAPLLHASGAHLFGNALALVLIGVLLEPAIGRGWFAAVYAASGFGGEIGSLIGNPAWLPGVGASGAISGLIAAAFAMSFAADSPEDGARMRLRALIFAAPALAPLALGAQGRVNACAHFGGALTGGGLALVLIWVWDGTTFRPPLRRLAGALAGAGFGLAAPAFACAAGGYAAAEARAAAFLPASTLEREPLADLAQRAPKLERLYPLDPMARILSAARLAELGRLAEGEAKLRAALAMDMPARPWAERPLRLTAQGFLATLLNARGLEAESLALAAPLCLSEDSPNVAEMLRQSKLCENRRSLP